MCRLPGIYVVGTRNNDSVREQCRHPEKMEEGDKAPCLPRRQVACLATFNDIVPRVIFT
jgi:hypothetical protein